MVAYRILKRQDPHIFQTFSSEMEQKYSAPPPAGKFLAVNLPVRC
jgi:hypothetical protein